jgi:hypothetical protein
MRSVHRRVFNQADLTTKIAESSAPSFKTGRERVELSIPCTPGRHSPKAFYRIRNMKLMKHGAPKLSYVPDVSMWLKKSPKSLTSVT